MRARQFTLNVNGDDHRVMSDPSTPLLYVLRNDLRLNGAKYGCGLGQCGSCTVQLDGAAIFSCLVPIATVKNRRVRTVEGLGTGSKPGILQQAFAIEQAAQCGYCTAGMIMRAQTILDRTQAPSDSMIRAEMQPNLCRCGTQLRVVRAIHRAAEMMRNSSAKPHSGS
jgi:aerobic-type carbon monoxide dehydrogenase small subunit (CoxS/CutS family)